MNLTDIFSPELIICKAEQIHTKTNALQLISNLISQYDLEINRSTVLEALLKRERLGSTAIGHGVAIPHARIADLKQPMCLLMTLDQPIDFENEEQGPVDLIITLLVPEKAEQKHLDILATLTEALKNKEYREQLRHANSKESLYQIACGKTDVIP